MADLPTVTVEGKNFPNIRALLRSTVIGDIPVKVALEQTHTDKLSVSRFPIQDGAPITDHAYKDPPGLRLRCGWSNSDIEAIQQIASGIVSEFKSAGSVSSGIKKVIKNKSQAAASYIDGIYTRLINLQESLTLFNVITIRRKYENMLMTTVELITDPHTAHSMMVEVNFEQFIIVKTQNSQLPAMANQANPASTAEVQNTGAQSVQPGAPAPGGANPPTNWTPKPLTSIVPGN